MKLLTTLSTCFAILIFGGCAESDPDTDVVESVPLIVPLTDIVNDVEAHGANSKYKGQKVTITAVGRIAGQFTALTLNPAIELFTHNDKVRFFIEDSEFDAALDMGNYYFAYMKSDLAHIPPAHNLHLYTFYTRPFRKTQPQEERVSLLSGLMSLSTSNKLILKSSTRHSKRLLPMYPQVVETTLGKQCVFKRPFHLIYYMRWKVIRQIWVIQMQILNC